MKTSRAITSEDWKVIDQKLKGFHNPVVLICDGYELTLMLERIGQFKNAITVFINGKVEGKWFIENCEERRRFFCPKSKRVYSNKDMAAFRKISKRVHKEMQAKNKFLTYEPYWTNFRALKSHLIKHNQRIELIVEERERVGQTQGSS